MSERTVFNPESIRGFGLGVPDMMRMADASRVLAWHSLRFLDRWRTGEPLSSTAANELRRAFEELGPTYVKLAQIIASSPGLFPEVLADEFKACLDAVPPASYEQVEAVIREDLGSAPEKLFLEFSREPLASASVAQVHTARLDDGEEVVVKVQRPGIVSRLERDLRILMRISRVLERVSARGRMANPVAVIEDFSETLAEELNFASEGRAMERFERNLRDFGSNERVRVPSVRWRYTTARVLTMERIYGHKIDDLARLRAQGWDLSGSLKRGVRAWMEAAFEHGFFHGDLHAGNLMLDMDSHVVFLDFGIMGRLDAKTKGILRRGLPALLVRGDFKEVAQTIYELGAVLKPGDLDESSRDIAEILQPILGRPLSEISYGQVLFDIIRVGTRYDVRLPRELVLVAKQLLYFERYAKLMAPDWAMLNDPDLVSFMFEGLETQPHVNSGIPPPLS